ncbi:phage-related protein [Variovorax sp. OAS795]|uniref:hypothetical protein n=1 Tax=Variovorax sp. OAS795 TaxID=3034231 RepID=UPI00339650B0
MTIFFKRLKVGHPEPLSMPPDAANSWKTYTVLESRQPQSCMTRADIAALNSNDRQDARTSFIALVNRAQTGEPLTALYDKTRCHEAFTFKPFGNSPNTVKVWRIWGAGAIRMYFIYHNKNIILLRTMAKRTQKLSKGDIGEIGTIAKSVLNAFQSLSLRIV